MDIDGGMRRNVYDSMAEGVTGAGCVVAFMSAEYERSENCRLELQYAKQLGRPIVPVLMEREYTAAGWLGIVTAGAPVWTPLFDPAGFDAGVRQHLATEHISGYLMCLKDTERQASKSSNSDTARRRGRAE